VAIDTRKTTQGSIQARGGMVIITTSPVLGSGTKQFEKAPKKWKVLLEGAKGDSETTSHL